MRSRIFTHLKEGSCVLVGMAISAFAHTASALYADPPQTTPGPGNVLLLDLTGAAAPPITLAPGGAPAFGFFLPAASSGPSICAQGKNAAAAAVQCLFTDNDPAAAQGWHGEWVIHNPNAGPVSFYAAFFDGWGNKYAGPATLGAGSSLWVDMLLADASPLHFSETGITRAWAASTIPVPMNASFSVSEGLAAFPAGTGFCPHPVGPPSGVTPEGEFGCRFRFFSDPADKWETGDAGNLPTFGISDPTDLQKYPDLLRTIPEPDTWAVMLAGLGFMFAALRRMRASQS